MRCRECGDESLDSRWSPLCPVCYESLRHEQRRVEISPPALEDRGWSDLTWLEAAFDRVLGPELP